MAIRFPQMHIAQSTANRILNIAAGMPAPERPAVMPPMLPDVAVAGHELDAQLRTPAEPVEAPAGAEGAVLDASLAGDDLAQAVVAPLLGPTANQG